MPKNLLAEIIYLGHIHDESARVKMPTRASMWVARPSLVAPYRRSSYCANNLALNGIPATSLSRRERSWTRSFTVHRLQRYSALQKLDLRYCLPTSSSSKNRGGWVRRVRTMHTQVHPRLLKLPNVCLSDAEHHRPVISSARQDTKCLFRIVNRTFGRVAEVLPEQDPRAKLIVQTS